MERGGAEVLVRGKYLEFLRDNRGWEYVRRPGNAEGVSIAAVTPEGRLVLVEQYRVPLQRQTLELPAGLVDPGEDAAVAAGRELAEETGFKCASLRLLCHGPTSAGMADEVNGMYLASGLERLDGAGDDVTSEWGCVTHGRTRGLGDEGERIIVREVPLDAVAPWLAQQERAGKAVDLKIYTALFFAGAQAPGTAIA